MAKPIPPPPSEEEIKAATLWANAQAYHAFVGRMLQSARERKYDVAFGQIEEAKSTLQGQQFVEALPTWQACVEACRATRKRARSRLDGLVGQAYKVYVRTSSGGRIGIVGKVEKVEAGKLYVRNTRKVHEVPVAELDPTMVARLGADDSPQDKFGQAALPGGQREGWLGHTSGSERTSR